MLCVIHDLAHSVGRGLQVLCSIAGTSSWFGSGLFFGGEHPVAYLSDVHVPSLFRCLAQHLFFGICHIMRIDDVTCHVPWRANGLRQGSQPGAWVGGFICLLPATEILFVASFRLRWLKCPCRPGRHGPQFWGHSMTPDLGQTRMTRTVLAILVWPEFGPKKWPWKGPRFQGSEKGPHFEVVRSGRIARVDAAYVFFCDRCSMRQSSSSHCKVIVSGSACLARLCIFVRARMRCTEP